MEPRSVFVTGATGYLGTRLIRRLLARGHRVRGLVRPGSERRLPPGCTPVVGNALDHATYSGSLEPGATLVPLVGTPHPAPWKGAQFRAVDLVSLQQVVLAAHRTPPGHVVYVSIARPAPVMHAYLEVRAECERLLAEARLRRTILRPWYILGPGHWWPLALKPAYAVMERLPVTRAMAHRLGLVTLEQMLTALVWAVEHPPAEPVEVIDVTGIRTIGTRGTQRASSAGSSH